MSTTYFVSYTTADRAWAEWIAWVLEASGATVTIQAWDFRAGNNFVLEMQRASAAAQHTIAVLSPDYLESQFAAPEWAAAVGQDPTGRRRALIPVRVRECRLEGLLPTTVYIDLVGLDEATARNRLLTEISGQRGKPQLQPPFPGATARAHPDFPGSPPAQAPAGPAARNVYIPKIRGATTDLDRLRFIKQAFDTVRAYFQNALAILSEQPAVDTSLSDVSDTSFTAEIFVHGNRRARCRIWLGGSFGGGNQISYYEGQDIHGSNNALNEALTINRDDSDLTLSAIMNMGLGMSRVRSPLDPNRMSPDDAAEYLWHRFTWGLE